jgi:hypothetical protein
MVCIHAGFKGDLLHPWMNKAIDSAMQILNDFHES